MVVLRTHEQEHVIEHVGRRRKGSRITVPIEFSSFIYFAPVPLPVQVKTTTTISQWSVCTHNGTLSHSIIRAPHLHITCTVTPKPPVGSGSWPWAPPLHRQAVKSSQARFNGPHVCASVLFFMAIRPRLVSVVLEPINRSRSVEDLVWEKRMAVLVSWGGRRIFQAPDRIFISVVFVSHLLVCCLLFVRATLFGSRRLH